MDTASDAPARAAGFVARTVERWRAGHGVRERDSIAEEVPVAMVYNGTSFAVMMATPHDLEDFALGFSLSEGLVAAPEQLLQVQVQELLEGIRLAIQVSDDAPVLRQEKTARLLPGRSGCGICGTRELEQVIRHGAPVGAGEGIARESLEHALAQLQTMQPINAATGAVHAAAWADSEGRIALVREDVGRHNALDKLIGALRRGGIDTARGMALVTSRASYEMVTKAASAGITVLAAISAPTALAIQLAHDARLTLIGFARPGSHNVYTHPERLRPAARQESS